MSFIKYSPVDQPYRLTSRFGKRNTGIVGSSKSHKGLDFGAKRPNVDGDNVYAVADGVVEKAGLGTGYGNVIYLNHSNGYSTRYAHLSKILVKVGQSVKAGQVIGLMGKTGIGSGTHLHFEVRAKGVAVDPRPFLMTDDVVTYNPPVSLRIEETRSVSAKPNGTLPLNNILAYDSISEEDVSAYLTSNEIFIPRIIATMNKVSDSLTTNMGSTNLRRFLRKDRRLILTPSIRKTLTAEINYILSLGKRKAANVRPNVAAGDQRVSPNSLSKVTWANAIHANIQESGNALLRGMISSPSDIVRLLDIENGPGSSVLSGGKSVGSSGFMGPLQIGMDAWKDGPAKFSKHASDVTVGTLRGATMQNRAESPADLKVMAPGIVEYWNKAVTAHKQFIARLGAGAKAANKPSDWRLLYAIHNQGGLGAARLIATGVIPYPKQSEEALAVLKQFR